MKSFKQYLLEKSYKIKTAPREWEYMLLGALPLNDWIFRKKGIEFDVPQAFRIDSTQGMKKFGKQGKTAQLPVFTKGSTGIANGAKEPPHFLLELEGKSFAKFDLDARTVLDRNGKRWLLPSDHKRNKYFIDISNKILKLVTKKLGIESYKALDDIARGDAISMFRKRSGKEKREFIRWYYSTAKKLMPKDFEKKVSQILDTEVNATYTNDELLLHEYKLKKVWLIEEAVETFLDYEEGNFLYSEFMDDETGTFIKFLEKKGMLKKLENRAKEHIPSGVKYCGIIPRNEIPKIDVSKRKVPKC